jgi:hypothetical protein
MVDGSFFVGRGKYLLGGCGMWVLWQRRAERRRFVREEKSCERKRVQNCRYKEQSWLGMNTEICKPTMCMDVMIKTWRFFLFVLDTP